MGISTLGAVSATTAAAAKWAVISTNVFSSTGGTYLDDAGLVCTLTSVPAGAVVRWHFEGVFIGNGNTPFDTLYRLAGTAVASKLSAMGTLTGAVATGDLVGQPVPFALNNTSVQYNNFPATLVDSQPPVIGSSGRGQVIVEADFTIATGGSFTVTPGYSANGTFNVFRRASIVVL